MKNRINLTVVLAVLSGAACAASAQWSSDPANNLALGDRTGDQVQAKIKPTSDGGAYVSWFDNSTGGYDVYLQRLDAQGNELWAHNGILLCDRHVSSTQDYDLDVDAAGNALVSYNDDLNVQSGPQQITVTKIAPDGSYLWGSHGVTITTNTNSKGPPFMAVLTDGNIMVGWSENNTVLFQKLDSTGATVGSQFVVSETSHPCNLCDIEPADNGSFIALWARNFTTNFMSARWLYAQKFDPSYNTLWTPSTVPVVGGGTTTLAAVDVYAPQPSTPYPTGSGTYSTQGGSIQLGYFPTFVSDGAGGTVFGWYENGGPRNAYLQHILADGTMKFPLNGFSNAVTVGSRIRISGFAAYDPVGQDYFVASTESANPTQGQYSTFVQRIRAGATPDAAIRSWGDTGTTIIPSTTGNQQSWVVCVATGNGNCTVAGIDSRTATTGVIFAAGIDGETGHVAWSNLASSTIATKSRIAAARSVNGFSMIAFQSGNGDANMYAQNINDDGTYGNGTVGCDADLNGDGNVDQGDIDYLVNVIGGGDNPTGIDPDFNHDGNPDQGDLDALVNVIAGGDCP